MWPKLLWKNDDISMQTGDSNLLKESQSALPFLSKSSVQKLTFQSSAKPDYQGNTCDIELFEELKKNNTLLQTQIKHLEQKDTLMQNAASRRVSHDFWLIFHVVITHAQMVLTENKLRWQVNC